MGTDDRASAVVLAPALVLVLLVLGAIAVDLSLVHTARRSAHRSLSAAADDAAAMIDSREFQRSGSVQLDPAAAERVALAHLGLLDGDVPDGFSEPAFTVTEAEIRADVGEGVVHIEAVVEVPRVFSAALPGTAPATTRIAVTGRML